MGATLRLLSSISQAYTPRGKCKTGSRSVMTRVLRAGHVAAEDHQLVTLLRDYVLDAHDLVPVTGEENDWAAHVAVFTAQPLYTWGWGRCPGWPSSSSPWGFESPHPHQLTSGTPPERRLPTQES